MHICAERKLSAKLGKILSMFRPPSKQLSFWNNNSMKSSRASALKCSCPKYVTWGECANPDHFNCFFNTLALSVVTTSLYNKHLEKVVRIDVVTFIQRFIGIHMRPICPLHPVWTADLQIQMDTGCTLFINPWGNVTDGLQCSICSSCR